MTIELILGFLFRIFITVFFIILLITALFLIIRAYKVRAQSFYYAGIAWLLLVFSQILNQIFYVHVAIYAIFSKAAVVFIVIFTNLTFHKDRKSLTPKVILMISIITAIITWYFDSIRANSQFSYVLSRLFDFVHISIALDWLTISSYTAYTKIKHLDIQPWIKIRYKIIFIASPIFTMVYLVLIFHPFDLPFGDTSTILALSTFIIAVTLMMVYGLLFMIAWVMPNRLKAYLNREYQTIEDKELTEDELLQLIQNELS